MSNGARIGALADEHPADETIAGRTQEVERARVALSASLHDASEAGRGVVKRGTQSLVRPLLLGAGLLAGALLAAQLLRRAQGSRGIRTVSTRQAHSFWPELLRTATIALASSAGRRLAGHWISKHSEPRERSRSR